MTKTLNSRIRQQDVGCSPPEKIYK